MRANVSVAMVQRNIACSMGCPLFISASRAGCRTSGSAAPEPWRRGRFRRLLFLLRRRGRARLGRGLVADRVRAAVLQVEPLDLSPVERTGAETIEDGDLVTALVDGASPVGALAHGLRAALR